MPGVTLHLLLADRVLEHWRGKTSPAPFDTRDPALINAFHQGALGPDLGYFPGGHRFLSDLSHLVRSADLTRELVDSSSSPWEIAFSWGWVTHFQADLAIHPLVGRGVGEFLYGSREIFVDGSSNETAHLRVEVGLDAFYSHLFPTIRGHRMAPVFHGASIRFLANAYRRIYRIHLDPTLFLSSHLAAVRLSAQALRSIGLMSTALLIRPISRSMAGAQWFIRRTLLAVRGGLGRESLLLAYLNPIPPAEWLVEAVGEIAESFAERFHSHFESGLEELANFNLDTGGIEDLEGAHRGTRMTIQTLNRWVTGDLPHSSAGGVIRHPKPLPAPAQL